MINYMEKIMIDEAQWEQFSHQAMAMVKESYSLESYIFQSELFSFEKHINNLKADYGGNSVRKKLIFIT